MRTRRALALALAATVALGAGCSSAADRQVREAIARARAEDELARTRFASQALARPAWLLAPPVAVVDGHGRPAAAALASEPQGWVREASTLPPGDGTPVALDLVGSRGRVRVQVAEALGDALDPVRLGEVLAGVGVAARAEPPGANDPADLPLVQLLAADAVGAAVELEVLAADEARLGALAIVARTCALDGGAAAGEPTVRLVVRLESDAPHGRVVVRYDASREGESPDASAAWAARAIALGTAALVCDASAGDLGRYLLTLDGEYEARRAGDEPLRPSGARLDDAAWHRAVRAHLRTLCLGVPLDERALDAPLAR